MAADSDPGRRMTRGRKTFVWVGRVLAGLFVLAVIGWVVADVVYGHMLNVRLAELRRADEPLTVEEVLGPEPPAAENAAGIYVPLFHTELGGKHGTTSRVGGLGDGQIFDTLDLYWRYPNDPAKEAAARKLLATPAASEALAQLQEASSRPYCYFRQPTGAEVASRWKFTSEFRTASKLVLAKALSEAKGGSLREAADWLIVNTRMARQAAQEPTSMSYLMMETLYGHTSITAADILWSHDLPPEISSMLRTDLARLDAHTPHVRAVQGERAVMMDGLYRLETGTLDVFRSCLPGNAFYRLLETIGQPVWKLQKLYYLAHMDDILKRAKRPCEPYVPATEPRKLGILDAQGQFSFICDKLGRSECTILAHSRMFQIALALNDYHRVHRAYPERLADVGQAFPRDPFSGKEFLYRLHKDKYLLYSVGENGTDDGGRRLARGVGRYQCDLTWGRSLD